VLQAGPVYPGIELDLQIPIGTVLYPRIHLPVTLSTGLWGWLGFGGGTPNTVLNFYLVDFKSHDGPKMGWLADYNPASRVRALAIKYRAPGRMAASELTPEVREVLHRPMPMAERVSDRDQACARPDRACATGGLPWL